MSDNTIYPGPFFSRIEERPSVDLDYRQQLIGSWEKNSKLNIISKTSELDSNVRRENARDRLGWTSPSIVPISRLVMAQ